MSSSTIKLFCTAWLSSCLVYWPACPWHGTPPRKWFLCTTCQKKNFNFLGMPREMPQARCLARQVAVSYGRCALQASTRCLAACASHLRTRTSETTRQVATMREAASREACETMARKASETRSSFKEDKLKWREEMSQRSDPFKIEVSFLTGCSLL